MPSANVIFVSHDGALDPLGASQVVPYLVGLADHGFAVTLISFEKSEQWRRRHWRAATLARLQAHGVRWRPLRYRRGPRVAATLRHVLAGISAIAAEARRSPPGLVHCRGDFATALARWTRLPPRTPLLYDVRGFWSDERVEAGSWRRGGLVDRVVRRMEAGNLRRADGAVVLTRHAAAELLRRRPSIPFHRIIPTCADTAVFTPRGREEKAEFGLVYSGSLGGWYMGSEMAAFARSAAKFVAEPTLFLTPQAADAHRFGVGGESAEVRSVEPPEVAGWLRRARTLFFFIRPTPAKRASSPTKFAEGLATGLPILCNRGIGDLDQIVERENVGVLVDSFSESGYREAGQRLHDVVEDPQLTDRCRGLAEAQYSLKRGVDTYCELYRELLHSRQHSELSSPMLTRTPAE